MSNIIAFEQNELNDRERETIATAAESWGKMKTGQHLQDWLTLGGALMIGRKIAMTLAYTNQPKGKGYNAAFGEWKTVHGFQNVPTTSISDLLWVLDSEENKTILQEQLATMATNKRIRINSPSAARQLVAKFLKSKLPVDPNAPVKVSKQKELECQVADLEEKLAAAEDQDGSLFNLQRDPARQIGRVIAENISRSRWNEIKKVVEETLKKRDELEAAKNAKKYAAKPIVHAG